ncbi:hypothetical protein AVEN_89120-1 [Araneus ventricosus]|uniref:Uncharacterized protein n=1 Tax=Araneus ventricosus TaxID=182803 RepID=A0A4Y2B438_ARAVE|nr:hypothetical protein AVEN_89120-1 [Araneus ventricosus]
MRVQVRKRPYWRLDTTSRATCWPLGEARKFVTDGFLETNLAVTMLINTFNSLLADIKSSSENVRVRCVLMVWCRPRNLRVTGSKPDFTEIRSVPGLLHVTSCMGSKLPPAGVEDLVSAQVSHSSSDRSSKLQGPS